MSRQWRKQRLKHEIRKDGRVLAGTDLSFHKYNEDSGGMILLSP